MRLFLGTRIPPLDRLDAQLLSELRTLGHGLRLVPQSKRHLTWRFLGDSEASGVSRLALQLQSALATKTGVTARLRGVGVFPSARRPSVVWAGVVKTPQLADLAAVVEDACTACGFASETRPFHPHVTLARVAGRPPAALPAWLERHHSVEIGEINLCHITLFESRLRPQGAEYFALADWTLDGGAT